MNEPKKNTMLLIDGGHLRALLRSLERKKREGKSDIAPRAIAENIQKIALACVKHNEEMLLRIFYYDCAEFTGYASRKHPHFDRDCMILLEKDLTERQQRGAAFYVLNARRSTPAGDVENQLVWKEFGHKTDLLKKLETLDLFAVRRGRLSFQQWDEDFTAGSPEKKFFPLYKQKGVDIKIGLDIASISINRQAQRIILVAGDTDFVPAMKFSRRHGVQMVLVDLPGHRLSAELRAHCDYLRAVNWPDGLEQYEPHYKRPR